MKPVQLVLTITFAIAALSCTIWLGRYQGKIDLVQPEAKAPPAAATNPLEIPAEGPFGKAVATETSFDFGVAEKGDTGSHIFLIKNEGQGPLRVMKGTTSCGQCTFGSVSPEDEDIPPGGTAEVQVKWKIAQNAKFRQTADVYTTDPDNRTLVFAILGLIDAPLHLVPEGTWNVGDLSTTDPTKSEGLLFSTVVDDIPIDRVECANPLVNVTWEPATAAVLKEREGKAGLKIKVEIAPSTTIGPVRETVKLHTSVRGGTVIEFALSGKRQGPIEIKGTGFNTENNVAKLGEFSAAIGARAKLKMYVRNLEGELDAVQIASENQRAKVSVAATGQLFGKSRIYDVEVEVPPGPPIKHRDKNAEPVVLKVNHPLITEFKMFVDYHAE